MAVLFILLLICIIGWFASSSFLADSRSRKGRKGELLVSRLLFALPNDYLVFNDLYLDVNGRTVQIDHVVVSVYGIFVIETKNYAGWIFGSDNSEYWTQCIYGNKYKFLNPLKQNFSHVCALRTLLNIPGKLFVPIVVFLSKAELKFQTYGGVVTSRELHDAIFERREKILTEEMVYKISSQLEKINIKDEGIRKDHASKIQEILKEKRLALQNGICPKCGSPLTVRKGVYGKFLGCKNYPYCKFKMNL